MVKNILVPISPVNIVYNEQLTKSYKIAQKYTINYIGFNEYGQLCLGDNDDRNIYINLDLHFDIFNKKPIEHILNTY